MKMNKKIGLLAVTLLMSAPLMYAYARNEANILPNTGAGEVHTLPYNGRDEANILPYTGYSDGQEAHILPANEGQMRTQPVPGSGLRNGTIIGGHRGTQAQVGYPAGQPGQVTTQPYRGDEVGIEPWLRTHPSNGAYKLPDENLSGK